MGGRRWAHNGACRLHYLDLGGDERAALLFLPGLGEEAAEYEWLADDLAPRRVVIADLRGRGASDAPESGYDLAPHVADLDAVIDDAGLARFHLATFSRGTAYGLAWTIEHPDRVMSLVIGDYLAWHPKMPEDTVERFHSASWRGRPVADRMPLHAVQGIAREATDMTYWECIDRVTAPITVIQGTAKGAILSDSNPERLEHWRRHRPDAEVVPFEGSGHDIFRPDPHRVTQLLTDVMRRAEGS